MGKEQKKFPSVIRLTEGLNGQGGNEKKKKHPKGVQTDIRLSIGAVEK